jgi:Amt family ammonium transporter
MGRDMACNGYLAGLVAITAPCAFVNVWGASIIGMAAGLITPVSAYPEFRITHYE